MNPLQELRSKYPEYSDMPDKQFVDSFHSKYYSDMDKDVFYAKIGFKDTETKNIPDDKRLIGTEPPPPEWAGQYPNLYGMYGAGREVYKTLKPTIEALGMYGGGVVGAGSGFLGGAGLGAIPGGAAGAALGYGIARNATGLADQLFGIGREENASMGNVIKATAKDMAIGALGGPPPAKKAFQAVPSKVGGITLTPAEAVGNAPTLAQIESLGEQIPFSSDIFMKWRTDNQLGPLIALRNKYLEKGMESAPRAEELGLRIRDLVTKRITDYTKGKVKVTEDLKNKVLAELGAKDSIETLGAEAKAILEKNSAIARDRKNELYAAVDDVIPQGELPFTSYQAEAKKNLDEFSKLPTTSGELKKVLRWGSGNQPDAAEMKLLEEISAYPKDVQAKIMDQLGITDSSTVVKDWKTMQSHRRELSNLIKQNDESIKKNNPALKGQLSEEGLVYKRLRNALDEDMKRIAEESGGDVLEKFNLAQAFYSKEYSPVWKNKVIKDMAYKRPSDLVDIAIKPGSTTEVDLARKALGDLEFDKTVKRAFTNKLFRQGDDIPWNPQKLQKDIANYGDETLLRVYTPDELENIKIAAKTGRMFLEKEMPRRGFLEEIAKTSPNVIVDSIVGSVERTPSSKNLLNNVSAVLPWLPDKEKAGLRLEILEKVFKVNNYTKYVEPKTTAKNIENYDRVLKLVLDKKELAELKEFTEAGRLMARAQMMAANPSGTAKNVISFGTMGELLFKPIEYLSQGEVAKAAGQFASAVGSKVIGARTLAQIYLSPKGRNTIMKAMVTPRYTTEGMNLAKQISLVLGNEELDNQGGL